MNSLILKKLTLHRLSVGQFPLLCYGSRLLSTSGSDTDEGALGPVPEWIHPDPPLPHTKPQDDDNMESQMELFFKERVKEEGAKKSRLFKTSPSPDSKLFPNKDAIQAALATFEEEFHRSNKEIKYEAPLSNNESAVQFSSQFGTFRSSFMKELSDVGLNDLPETITHEKQQSGMVQDFLNGFGAVNGEALVESMFGPEKSRKPKQRNVFNNSSVLLKESVADLDSEQMSPIPKGGFRISIYRNVTGSIKVLLQSVRNDVLPRFIEKTRKEQTEENQEFLTMLIDSLKFSQHPSKMSILPQMNTLCLMLLERLPYLSPDEMALVCLVFGKLGFINSLVFHRLFEKLQDPHVMGNLSTEGLFGSVLSLGMLHSTDPAFLNSAKAEFEKRFRLAYHPPIPRNSLGSFLFGCCRSKDPDQATSLSQSVLDVLCKDDFFLKEESISWSDLALALYVTCQLNIWKPELITGIHTRLKKSPNRWDLKCMEVAALLIGLENQPPSRVRHEVQREWHEAYAMLGDRVESLMKEGQVEATCVPDLIRSFSFPGHERVHTYETLGKMIVSSGEIIAPLPLWSLCFRLMAGYANTRYRDVEVLKALNRRFLATRMATISSSTIIQLLHIGLPLRGIEERVVDRLVELMQTTPHFWKKIHRPKDAAKAAYALAGFEKLTPEILRHCWERCSEIDFLDASSKSLVEKMETMFTVQGLFAGYQYISRHYSPEIAQQQIPEIGRNALFKYMKNRHLSEVGMQSAAQRDVANCLESIGIEVSYPALIENGLYSADIALHHQRVVIFLFGRRSYFCNEPDRLTGRTLMHLRELEALGIKVIQINSRDWSSLDKNEQVPFLEKAFADQGLCLRESPQEGMESEEIPSSEEFIKRRESWMRDRIMVLKEQKVAQLKKLNKSRAAHAIVKSDAIIKSLSQAIVEQNGLKTTSKAKQSGLRTAMTKGMLIHSILTLEVNNKSFSINLDKQAHVSRQ